MLGRSLVVLALLCALAALAVVGAHALHRDRAAMYEQFAAERTKGLEAGAHVVARDLADVDRDLELAASLLRDADTLEVAERELNAIATIKREYLAMGARTENGVIHVVAFDSPPGTGGLVEPEGARMLAAADALPDRLHVSGPLGIDGARGSWDRVFARRSSAGGPPVDVAIDVAMMLGRLGLERDPESRMLVISPNGIVPSASDAKLAAFARGAPWLFERIGAYTSFEGNLASAIGLPHTRAVVTCVPIHIDAGPAWRLIEVTSTSALAAQERTLVRRVVVGASLVLALLLAAAGYVIYSIRRAAMLRERLRHADRLAHLTDKAEKILDHIPSGVIAISDDRRITAANRRFVERFRDVTGRKLEDAFKDAPAEDVAALTDVLDLAAATRTAQSVHRAQFRLLGDEAYFSIHVVPLARSISDVSTLVVFDDLTKLRRIEERLLHSEKLVTAGQLAAGIAHEIGTPLNVARGRVEMVLSHLGEAHPDAASQQIALEQIDRVTRLIQQLLDYVRSVPAAMQHVDVAAAMRAVSELLAPPATKRGVTLRVEAPADLPLLHADPDQIQQILVNLVLNAIDACEPGGHVELRARMQDAAPVIEVSDDGHGIAREIQAQVFDPFFTTKKRGQGTGLGLWVVAQLVRAHHADIELDTAPGEGTTVRIAWPRAA